MTSCLNFGELVRGAGTAQDAKAALNPARPCELSRPRWMETFTRDVPDLPRRRVICVSVRWRTGIGSARLLRARLLGGERERAAMARLDGQRTIWLVLQCAGSA